jgi:HlyD family secretion protein
VTEPATRGPISDTVEATGTLEAEETVQVGSEVSGRLAEVAVDFNAQVTAGQVLARIDPEQLDAALEQAKAQLQAALAAESEAKAAAHEASSAARRAEVEAAAGLLSTANLETRQAAAERASASVRSAQANVRVSRANLSAAEDKRRKAVIVAPSDGFVLARYVSVGQTVTAGFSTPVLFDIAKDLGRMRLIVDVDEADVGRVAEGDAAEFTVDAWPGERFPTKVTQLRYAPTTTNNVVTYEAVLEVSNAEHRLRPGMTATARVVADHRDDALLVPSEALRFAPDGAPASLEPRVFVLEAGKPREVKVKPGLSDGRLTEVGAGEVPAGAEVIVDARAEGKR